MAFMKKLAPLSGIGLAATLFDKKKKPTPTSPQPSLITEGTPAPSGSLVSGTTSNLY